LPEASLLLYDWQKERSICEFASQLREVYHIQNAILKILVIMTSMITCLGLLSRHLQSLWALKGSTTLYERLEQCQHGIIHQLILVKNTADVSNFVREWISLLSCLRKNNKIKSNTKFIFIFFYYVFVYLLNWSWLICCFIFFTSVVNFTKRLPCKYKRPTGLNGHLSILAHAKSLIFPSLLWRGNRTTLYGHDLQTIRCSLTQGTRICMV
jgi:hypothetical protein